MSSEVRPCNTEAMNRSPSATVATTVITQSESQRTSSDRPLSLITWMGVLVWPCMMALPLSLTISFSPLHFTKLFPSEWYEYDNGTDATYPKPLGLVLGITAVAVGQVFVWIFFYFYKFGYLSGHVEPVSIQRKGSQSYRYWEGVQTHISQPEGFAVLAGYLTITWMLNLMPVSYYQFNTNGIQYAELMMCLVIQDGIQYVMHRLEHDLSPIIYQKSHKPHHRFLNPRLFDAFNGSLADTICMIVIPLYVTANIVRTTNVWTYMAFGSTYACWLTLIHSEYVFPWDPLFRKIGFGTPADHHVHHAFFKYNYGHLFMWFDQLAGTYQNPKSYASNFFNDGV
jgi:alternative squalene epoxidase